MGHRTGKADKDGKHLELRRKGGDFNVEKVNSHVDEDQIKFGKQTFAGHL